MNARLKIIGGLFAVTMISHTVAWGQTLLPQQTTPQYQPRQTGTIYSNSRRFTQPEPPANSRIDIRRRPTDSYARRSTRPLPIQRDRFDTPEHRAAIAFEMRRRQVSPINRQMSDLRDPHYERQIRNNFWSQFRMR